MRGFFLPLRWAILPLIASLRFSLASLIHPRKAGVIGAVIEFLGVFALTQIPLAVAEGIVTVLIFNLIAKYGADETKSLDVFYEKGGAVR